MAEVRVADVRAHAEDAVGVPIEFVYAKDVPLYAVYRTPERVLIHFADALDKRVAQRRDLIRFNPIRGEINGLINGWRTSKYAALQSRARRFDRRVADALTVALEGDLDGASLLLDRVKQDIIAERTSWARFLYLMIASGAVLVLLLLSTLRELRDEPEWSLAPLVKKMSPVDLVLVEGYKRDPFPKLEIHRVANGKPLIQPNDPHIVAIAADVTLPDAPVPVIALDDIDGIADLVMAQAVPVEQVV